MPVQLSDIRIFGSAGIPLADTDTPVGGAADPTTEMVFTNISALDNFQVVSSSTADTGQSVVITGRKPNGAITTETVALTGQVAAPCAITTSWKSLLVGDKQQSCAGVIAIEAATALFQGVCTGSQQLVTLTAPPAGVDLSFCVLRVTAGTGNGFIGIILSYNISTGVAYLNVSPSGIDGTTVLRIGPGMVFRQVPDGDFEVMTVRRPFYNASAPVPASPTKSILEKVFVYNDNNTLTLNSVQIQQTLQNNINISVGLDAALDGVTLAVGNRIGASPVAMFTGTPVAVPGTALPSNTGIGVWLQLNLMPGAPTVEAPLNLQILGI